MATEIMELVEETTNSQSYTKVPRAVLVQQLRDRDGDLCMHPDCTGVLDFNVTDGPLEVTVDHWMPQHYGKANGWSMEKIWALSNLKLMHKKCNAKKGDLIPNTDGTLPKKAMSTFQFRRMKRATRPELCHVCDNGRKLGPQEVCASCNSGPQPERWPRWAKVKSSECDHELFWCWACGSGVVDRVSAASVALLQGESGEWD